MPKLRKPVLWLCLLSLLGGGGAVSFCSSCGPVVMDCCKKAPESKESLSQSSCCDFVMRAPGEPHPARISMADSRGLPADEADLAAHEMAVFPDRATHPAPRMEFSNDTSPPIFLRNVTLLC